MAIDDRAANVRYLQEHIPSLEVVWDKNRDTYDTFFRSLQHSGTDRVIRLQDDVCLTQRFMEKAESVIAERPDDVITFFTMSKFDIEIGSRYRSGRQWMMNQCYYLPEGVAAEILLFSETWLNFDQHKHGDDQLMREYFQSTRRQHWVSVPSLVEHARIVSAIDKRRSKFRQSKTFIEPELRGYPYGLEVGERT